MDETCRNPRQPTSGSCQADLALTQFLREVSAQGAHDSFFIQFVREVERAGLEPDIGFATKDEASDIGFVFATIFWSILIFFGRLHDCLALLIVICYSSGHLC